MDQKAEEQALKLFQKATHKLFNERIDESFNDFIRIISMYPDTLIALKSRFLICITWKTVLYAECLLTEAFSNGISAIKINPVLDLFNKDRKYFISNYEHHANKRKNAYQMLRKAVLALLEVENKKTFPIIHMFINISKGRLKDCDPLEELDIIRDGKLVELKDLHRLIKDLYFYIFVTIISDDFDIEYTDKLSSLSKHKLNRIDFYHSCMNWCNMFYNYEQDYRTGELIRRCSIIILGLTSDSANPKRQEAYETLSKMSKDFYTMAMQKEDIEETPVKDIEEEQFRPEVPVKQASMNSLMDLVCYDESSDEIVYHKTSDNICRLALEINLNPSEDILKAREELYEETIELAAEEDFGSMLEFD